MLILLLVIAWPISGNEKEKTKISDLWYRNSDNIDKTSAAQNHMLEEKEDNNAEERYRDTGQKDTEYLENKLEDILSSMQGVGKVKVMITLADSGEEIIEKDIPADRSNMTEMDSTGGSRNTNEINTQETTVYVTNAAGEKIPYVINKKSPLIEGVTVVAQGGDSILVKKCISDAIQALFGIEEHKIIVVKMKQEE